MISGLLAAKITDVAGSAAVVVSDRYDLFATQGLYSFNEFTSHYANPFARYRQRLRWMQDLSTMSDPAEVAWALRSNPYDRVGALVLTPGAKGRLLLSYRQNRYPYGTTVRTITFRRSVFAPSHFEVTAMKGSVLIIPRRGR